MPDPLTMKAAEKGLEAAGGAVNAGMGMLLGAYNDKRQLKQQDRLLKQQEGYNRNAAQFSHDLQYDMWQKTNYPAQMEQMKKAGLNPALMYGMSGGGGTTTGSATQSAPQGGGAPAGGGEAMAMMQMGMQQEMMKAQIELAKAQANKTNVEAGKIGGVDTQLAQGQLSKIISETTSEGLKQGLLQVEANLKDLELYEKQGTLDDRMKFIGWQTEKAMRELEMVERNNFIQKATQNAVIDEIRAKAVGAVLQNVLTQASTENVRKDTELKGTQQEGIRSNIRLNDQQINTMIQRLMQDWDSLGHEGKRTRIQQELATFTTDTDRRVNEMATQTILGILSRGGAGMPDQSRHYYGDSYHDHKK